MSQDKDELAKLLGEMAEGEHADDEHAAHADHDDHIGHLTEPAPPPATSPKPTPPTPVAKAEPKPSPTPPRPELKSPTPKSSLPPAQTPPRPAPAASRAPVKPALPPRPAAVPKPQAPAPAPTPKPLVIPGAPPTPLPMPIPQPAAPIAAPAPIITDEEEPERYSGTDDDAVIVPAMAATGFISKPRVPVPRRQHLAQKLYFKQTIIPILLTLGLICLAIPTIGLLSSQYSPFKALGEIYFLATFWPLGIAFVVFGFLTMFSVKKELEPPTPPTPDS